MSGFGLSKLRREGSILHPDDIIMSGELLSDDEYFNALSKHASDLGLSIKDCIEIYGCARPHLFDVNVKVDDDK